MGHRIAADIVNSDEDDQVDASDSASEHDDGDPGSQRHTARVVVHGTPLRSMRTAVGEEEGYERKTMPIPDIQRFFDRFVGLRYLIAPMPSAHNQPHDFTIDRHDIYDGVRVKWLDGPGLHPSDIRARRFHMCVPKKLARTSPKMVVMRVVMSCNGACCGTIERPAVETAPAYGKSHGLLRSMFNAAREGARRHHLLSEMADDSGAGPELGTNLHDETTSTSPEREPFIVGGGASSPPIPMNPPTQSSDSWFTRYPSLADLSDRPSKGKNKAWRSDPPPDLSASQASVIGDDHVDDDVYELDDSDDATDSDAELAADISTRKSARTKKRTAGAAVASSSKTAEHVRSQPSPKKKKSPCKTLLIVRDIRIVRLAADQVVGGDYSFLGEEEPMHCHHPQAHMASSRSSRRAERITLHAKAASRVCRLRHDGATPQSL